MLPSCHQRRVRCFLAGCVRYRRFCPQLGALVINLSPGRLKGLFPGKTGPVKALHMAFGVARDVSMAPVVIYVDECEQVHCIASLVARATPVAASPLTSCPRSSSTPVQLRTQLYLVLSSASNPREIFPRHERMLRPMTPTRSRVRTDRRPKNAPREFYLVVHTQGR